MGAGGVSVSVLGGCGVSEADTTRQFKGLVRRRPGGSLVV